MSDMLDRDDPISTMLEEGSATSKKLPKSGRFEEQTDEFGQPTGIELFIPTDEFRETLDHTIYDELDFSLRYYKDNIYPVMERNLATHAAIPQKKELLQVALAKRDGNQIEATYVNRIMTKKPVVSAEPVEIRDTEVLVATDEFDPETGERVSVPTMIPSDDMADGLEALFEYILKGPIPYRQFLTTVVGDMVRGVTPTWGENSYIPETRVRRIPKQVKLSKNRVIVRGVEVQRPVGFPYRIDPVSGLNMVMSPEALDPQDALLLGKKIPMASTKLREMHSAGHLNLVQGEDEEKIFGGETDLSSDLSRRATATGGSKMDARRAHEVFLINWYQPIVMEDGGIGVFDLCGYYHYGARKLMSCYVNPYEERQFYAYFYKKRPHQFTGDSPTEDVAAYQKIISTMMHMRIKNGSQRINAMWQMKTGSAAWEWKEAGGTLREGAVVTVNEIGQDVAPLQMPPDVGTFMPEVQWASGESSKLTVVDEFKRGSNIPGRTAAAAIAQVMDSGNAQPLMVLDALRDQLSRQLSGFLKMMSRHAIYGITIPFKDPETLAIINRAIAFPSEGFSDQFLVRITASSDEDTKQAEIERLMMLHKVKGENDDRVAAKLGPALEPNASPALKIVLASMVKGDYELMGRMLKLAGIDPKKYLLDERQIDGILGLQEQWNEMQQQVAQAQQMMQQMQAQQQQMMQGGNVVPFNQNPAGVLPPPLQEPGGGGMGPMAQPQGNPEFSGGPPPGGLPPPNG